jgi:hypothetical protein
MIQNYLNNIVFFYSLIYKKKITNYFNKKYSLLQQEPYICSSEKSD